MTSKAWKRFVFVPDLHIPDHNVKAVNNLVQFISDYQPDDLINLGDYMDCLAPARWSRDTAAEFAETLQAECDAVVKVNGMIREVYDGPYRAHDGNHPARIRAYIEQKAPAFADLRALELHNLLEFEELGIERLGKFHPFAPGWVSTHGDTGSLSQTAGGTAMRLAKKIGLNVVCGHTHRAGIIHESFGLLGKTHTLTGVEAGNLMDIRKADYLKTGAANWQSGFSVFYVKGSKVIPHLIPVSQSGSFMVEGLEYV